MADSVVEMMDHKYVTLLLQNHGTEKLYLKRGMPQALVSLTTVLTNKDQDIGRGAEGHTESVVSRCSMQCKCIGTCYSSVCVCLAVLTLDVCHQFYL